MSGKRIVVLATLDTKSGEAQFVATCIQERGHRPWLVDLSLAGAGGAGDTSRDEVGHAAGQSWDAIAKLPRAEAMEIVAAGAGTLLKQMVTTGEAQAVIAIGGGTGTWLGMTIMRALPIGFPKLMVSTLSRSEGNHDITVMPSVADIAGLNSLLRPILVNAACAISGMAESVSLPPTPLRPTIALSMFGVTTRGATFARQFLEEAGCDVVVFHANGTGGATMEDLIRQGMFAGVLEWTTSEATDEIADGVCKAGPHRFEAAGERGIPQVVVPGAIDVINVRGAIPERFAGRTYHMHLPNVPLIRTSMDESREIAAWLAPKLSRALGPIRVLIPDRGFSALDTPGGVFEDRAANDAFVSTLQHGLRPDIPVEVLPHHINDEVFARAAADALLGLLPAGLLPATTRA